jgi:DNA-binding MarR family transcriptional regulator
MNHPIHDLDDVVHQRVRLGILATLIGGDRADFSTLCRGLDVTKGNLGQHLRMLEEAGYVAIDKAFENRRPRTQVSVTQHGRAAFAREGRALRRLLELAESAGTPTPDGATTDSAATNATATDSAATHSAATGSAAGAATVSAATGSAATVQPGTGTQPQSAHVSPGASNQTVGSQANATSVGSSAAVADAANQVPAPRVEAPQAAQDGTDASNSAQSQRVGFQTGTHPVPDPVA